MIDRLTLGKPFIKVVSSDSPNSCYLQNANSININAENLKQQYNVTALSRRSELLFLLLVVVGGVDGALFFSDFSSISFDFLISSRVRWH